MQLTPINVVACLLAAAVGTLAYEHAAPQLEYGIPTATAALSQYHTQDAYGQYSFGFTAPLYSKHETRTADGVTRGVYSYVDAAGQIQTVDYTADVAGFRVAATNLPTNSQLKPNEETPEVAALRAQHLAAHAETKARLRLAGDVVSSADSGLPQPVADTPEVAAAKVEFFKRFEAEQLRHKLLSANQQKPQSIRSQTILSQPLYVKAALPILRTIPAIGNIYDYKLLDNRPVPLPLRNYLPLA